MYWQCALLLLALSLGTGSAHTYEPTWPSLDSRPLPDWYDESKVGIFLHWGVFSVPGFASEWFWYQWKGEKQKPCVDYMKANYRPGFTYPDFAAQFRAQFFNVTEWADIFKASGAKYLVLTSKHHEGFCNWPSSTSWNWNSMDVGPRRDLVAGVKQVAKLSGLTFGLYHSLFEWFNPLFNKDKDNKFKSNDFVRTKTGPELYELVKSYEPEVLWSDGDWGASPEYWNSTSFLAWLYNDSPVKDTVVTNDRWGAGTMCKHGGYYTCADRFNPGVLQKHKWENAMTLDRQSWGYRYQAQMKDILSIQQLLHQLVTTVACGGNLLVNVGPTADGRIAPIYEERLRQMGNWLGINGQSIYKSRPWRAQNDTLAKDVWYTQDANSNVYATFFDWPKDNLLTLAVPKLGGGPTVAALLGWTGHIRITGVKQGVQLQLDAAAMAKLQFAWTIKLAGFK